MAAETLAAALTAGLTGDPAGCSTMAEVRAGVDVLDRAIVTLLARRFRFMDAAARIKPERGQVRDEPRKAAVVAHARSVAEREGAPADLIAVLYEQLVESSIGYELSRFDAR
ncbi:chorismate mutase [uncultured Sphingomonas sp.]|uniref:chorismate mutase n=1 Tax=uncultured Sphingomonas sp. TaxID=158754 RepID=UPI0035CB9D5D